MKEFEMRVRIEQLLEKAVRRAALPVSVGLTIAIGACGEVAPRYMGQLPDDTSVIDSAAGDPSAPAVKYMAQLPDAEVRDSGPAVRYMAQLPDAAPDPDDGYPATRYAGQLPRNSG